MLLEPASGFLRQIRRHDRLILNGIYAAVRDHNWETIEPVIHDLTIHQRPADFEATFTAVCRRDDIHFVWRGRITGSEAGGIDYEFDGEARSTFLKNRIGFCVLHDAACAGARCIVEHVDGTRDDAIFPLFISPHQPFKRIRGITHFPLANYPAEDSQQNQPAVELTLAGDVFEMEDQRNWTDASFKTYCTPLEQPFPIRIESGARIHQSVSLTLVESDQPNVTASKSADLSFDDGNPRLGGRSDFHPLPKFGLSMASHNLPLTDTEIERLKPLRIDHLRCDLTPLSPNWESRWREALRQATALACRLHVAIHLQPQVQTDRPTHQLESLARLAGDTAPVDAWIIFVDGEKSTCSQWTRLARTALSAAGGLIVGGTDAFFAELNRNRPERGSADAISWSINPQVHSTDLLSLLETLDAQWATAVSARQFHDGELMISPITLRPRFNPDATTEPPPTPPDVLPSQVDVRQMALFGAAWTLGSIASLSRDRLLRSVTYFETTGWLGVMEWAERPRLPHKFVTRPTWAFPMYFVFAWLAGFDECRSIPVDDRLTHTALMVRNSTNPTSARLLVGSFDRDHSGFILPPGFTSEQLTVLSQENAVAAMREPTAFLENGWARTEAITKLTLPPFAVAAIDGRLE